MLVIQFNNLYIYIFISLAIIDIFHDYYAQCQEEEQQSEIIVSLIYGFGIPWDVEGGYMTTGYVIRVQYGFPMKLKEWKPPYAKYFKNRRSTVERNETLKQIPEKVDNADGVLRKEKRRNDPNIEKYRWAAYHALEMHAKRLGYEGRACVLRGICEAATVPFSWKSGLLGELLHILLTPSTSVEPLTKHSDNEYLHAEYLGKSGAPCERIFKECRKSLLSEFSGVFVERFQLNM
ncbi:unnamed protein product [Hermetia illucens]|uniref:Uncharacterized protein n=1 Tax=Hermetia illucens TaxID=343691 RepID=A0A7R8UU59_HERIL|nr:uncharacterized protein LOC119655365 [Hermetia illucens]CAD7087078.1 unnamed protein product [Hermetia illucens]